ncbi:MAG: 3'-5' exonuclease [Rhodocyclaceae bacterium]|jgi:predicted PolB exonuclease-like 3'-5' exonuclease|nr:3'-5' exonuclease [Rhodocyclaceae bacterium]
MIPVIAFDIETIPDIAGLRNLHELPETLADAEVAEFAFQKQRAKNGSDFLPHHLQRVIVISCAMRSDEGFRVWSLAEPKSGEGEIIQRFYDGIGKYTPQIISWNGGGFDLPVLHYRGLIHGVAAPRYWDLGEDDRDFKWNNYISRYHTRHLDLMDLLAMYQPRANAPLDELAKLMGLPGKLGMDGSAVWGAWLDGQIDAIRDYCETDVVNTYMVYLRFQQMRGHLSAKAHAEEVAFVRGELARSDAPHWREFLAAWPEK